jgi:hypothetical protein
MNADNHAQQPPKKSSDFPAGLPIYDCNGEQLGVVSADGVLEQDLMMTKGRLVRREVAVPVSAIARSDAHGVYLSRTKREIDDLTLGDWSSLGDVDLNTGEPDTGWPASGPASTPDQSPERRAGAENQES